MRVFRDATGLEWEARLISHGRTSDYLNPRVHRPVIQFTCRARSLPQRYGSYDEDQHGPLDMADIADLQALLERAKSH